MELPRVSERFLTGFPNDWARDSFAKLGPRFHGTEFARLTFQADEYADSQRVAKHFGKARETVLRAFDGASEIPEIVDHDRLKIQPVEYLAREQVMRY